MSDLPQDKKHLQYQQHTAQQLVAHSTTTSSTQHTIPATILATTPTTIPTTILATTPTTIPATIPAANKDPSFTNKKKEEPLPIPLFCYRVIELLLSSFSTWFATFAVISSASVTASVVALVVLSTCVSVNTCVRSKISLTVNLTVANPYFDT